jgi:hypothetical protein
MVAYGVRASHGDDVFHEPSTKILEDHIARLTGKEAGLFLPSGTMSNQIALRAHLKQPPYSVLLDQRSHIYMYEAGGTALHSGAMEIPVVPVNGEYYSRRVIRMRKVTIVLQGITSPSPTSKRISCKETTSTCSSEAGYCLATMTNNERQRPYRGYRPGEPALRTNFSTSRDHLHLRICTTLRHQAAPRWGAPLACRCRDGHAAERPLRPVRLRQHVLQQRSR